MCCLGQLWANPDQVSESTQIKIDEGESEICRKAQNESLIPLNSGVAQLEKLCRGNKVVVNTEEKNLAT